MAIFGGDLSWRGFVGERRARPPRTSAAEISLRRQATVVPVHVLVSATGLFSDRGQLATSAASSTT